MLYPRAVLLLLEFFNFDIDVNQFSHLTLVSMPKIDFIGSQF